MMLGGSSSLIGNNSAAGEAHESGADSDVGGGGVGGGAILGGGFSDEDRGHRIEGGGGNRWPRQETLALLQIRSEMGVIFRDSNLKGPLWEEVSRKMAQLGYQRSAKKCKEKFENVYKYHKRTKDSRAAKADGKSYRFFEQLEALESSPSPISSLPPPPRLLPPPPPPSAPSQVTTNTKMPTAVAAVTAPGGSTLPFFSTATVTSAAIPVSFSPNVNNPMWSQLQQPQSEPQNSTNPFQGNNTLTSSQSHLSSSLMWDSMSSSSSTSSDIERRHKKKRKIKEFFDRLMKDLITKQEELQLKFLETLEKRERDRMIREEAWRVQEMARMNRELDLLAQERSKAAAKDDAMMTFLQKMIGQQSPQTPPSTVILSQPLSPSTLPTTATATLLPPPVLTPTLPTQALVVPTITFDTQPVNTIAITTTPIPKNENVGENSMTASSSRWPKAEVEALIGLRTNIDVKYLDNNPKGPLWEEISIGMSKLGYNRSAKRCKEKWENINKYFKKVKESNKKRPEDSKTCPYFQQLDAIYREKAKTDPSSYSTTAYTNTEKPRSDNPMLPLMVRPEQQWPLLRQEPAEEDHESDNMDENDHEDDEDDEDDGEGYEIVTNKQAATSMSVATTATE